MSDTRFSPGFYDDGSGTQRYWDGERWTDQVRSPIPASSSLPKPSTRELPKQTRAVTSRSPLERLERTGMKQRVAVIGGAMVIAFVVGIAAGSGMHESDEAVAAATASNQPSIAATSSPVPSSSYTAPPAPAVPIDVQETVAPEAEEAPEAVTEPDVTTRGLSRTDARLACSRFGEAAAPYGFKDHSILGVINEEIVRNRWFIKHEVTITNAFDAERDTVFECTVGGTTDSPKITEFYVYD